MFVYLFYLCIYLFIFLFIYFSGLFIHSLGRGSGLGLVLAKEIILMHGGRVVVESEEGSGSSFGFCIPFEIAGSNSEKEKDDDPLCGSSTDVTTVR